MISSPSRLTIFEGPDGAGKSTVAKAWAEATHAQYVHLGPRPEIKGPELAFDYIKAMLPAIRGNHAVVMDRCWISEKPYGDAFRHGQDRLGDAVRAELEALAMEASSASVVLCLPDWPIVKANFERRSGQEMLKNTDQLRTVFDAYQAMAWVPKPRSANQPRQLLFDYTTCPQEDLFALLYGLMGAR